MIRRPVLHVRWLIPARAGKTSRDFGAVPSREAHPRSRGENARAADDTSLCSGSSPLARGKRHSAFSLPLLVRLIPARAGKTLIGSRRAQWDSAHPRSRGENEITEGNWQSVRGSSPLARGKQETVWANTRQPRLIPARAGKTSCAGRTGGLCWAHPRSRGENVCAPAGRPGRLGSSPLARGKRRQRRPTGMSGRLIPARAGKTRYLLPKAIAAAAHPRSRGENGGSSQNLQDLAGSSPLARGKPGGGVGETGAMGLIPARAGKTSVCMASGP